ncbi:MAG: hypothetical protein RMK20_13985 [Verrucomicrobiales bacterium]|nr:hypothetical protein [Verrucomicrobiales bacterium]
MVKRDPGFSAARRRRLCCGALMTELAVAMSLLLIALLPLSYSILSERRLARALYQRAVAMELVDGELEVLAAGAWRAFAPGMHEYPVRAGAATNLPPGRFVLTVSAERLRLEWQPASGGHGGPVVREVRLR